VTDELEAGVTMQVVDISFGSSKQIVRAEDFMPLLQ
jgi:hypothetical protein